MGLSIRNCKVVYVDLTNITGGLVMNYYVINHKLTVAESLKARIAVTTEVLLLTLGSSKNTYRFTTFQKAG
jgi:hypothetical protein